MKKIRFIIPLLLLSLGLGVIIYPHVCQILYQKEAKQMDKAFADRMREIPADDIDALYEAMVSYNQQLFSSGQGKIADVFSFAQIDFSLMEFGLDEEMIGYISIPRMSVELPIYLGASEDNLSRGACHLTQTSLPVGGMNNNAVIAAHRGMGTKAMFRDIEKLSVGDDIYITNFRETLSYQVMALQIISPDNMNAILIQEGRDMVTLLTCHPYRFNHQRYVVYCERVTD